MPTKKTQEFAEHLMQQFTLYDKSLNLRCGDCVIRVQSNSAALLEDLRHYFQFWIIEPAGIETDVTVIAIDSETLELTCPFLNWPREAGKSGQKDAYYDFDQGRLIRKVRTGMLFLQTETSKIAVGPCLEYPNQVINFINSQHMNWLQQRGWLICHAAAIVRHNQSYAIAGFSGGGKSTFMLNLLNDNEINFLTNDRLFISQKNNTVYARGIAKHPRINPGTILNNTRLHTLISEQKRFQLQKLTKKQLWNREEKYDVHIESIYGMGRIASTKPLQAFIVLNWQYESEEPMQVNQVELEIHQDLLAAIMKSSGPFYQDPNGKFLAGGEALDKQSYLAVLSTITIYEVSGKIDFDALARYFYRHIIR